MSSADYHRAADLEEALALLGRFGEDAKVLAGGQSLVPMMSAGFLAPELLVDINRIAGLDVAAVEDGAVRIGALARHRRFERPEHPVGSSAPLLAPAARLVGHQAVRNRGTLVGSVVHADPSAEWPAVAVALGAEVHLASARGQRSVTAADFIAGPMTSAIEPDELAVELRLPVAPPRSGASVQELAYRHGDYAVVGVVAQLSLGSGEQVVDARLALFGVDAVPVRVVDAERLLVQAGAGGFEEAARLAQQAANPPSDATASAQYRRDMIPPFCLRALHEAHAAAQHSDGKLA